MILSGRFAGSGQVPRDGFARVLGQKGAGAQLESEGNRSDRTYEGDTEAHLASREVARPNGPDLRHRVVSLRL